MSCEVCTESAFKYRCPRCQLKTCCLDCVQKHKENSGCDGHRNKTAFVHLKEFSESHLKSDYHFLEDVGRKVSTSKRETEIHQQRCRSRGVQKLVTQARKRGVNLQILPYTFQKRRSNSTVYWNKCKKLMWQIEWNFPALGVKYTDSRVSEDRTLADILNNYLHPTQSDPIIRHQLQKYVNAGMENCTICFKTEAAVGYSKKFEKLKAENSLSDSLYGKQIVEYPSLFVLLPAEVESYEFTT